MCGMHAPLRIHIHTDTHTQKYRGREQILLLQKRRPVGRYPLLDETREKMIDIGRLKRGREKQTYPSNEGRQIYTVSEQRPRV